MATWIVKCQTDDLSRALEMISDQHNRGYRAWVEDEYGREVDTETFKNINEPPTNSKTHDQLIGLLIWLTAIIVGLGGLYVLGLWVDHDL